MDIDTSLSLELVITILAILGSVWRIQHVLEKKIDDLRKDMQAGDAALRKDMQAGHAALREEMLAGHAALREEMSANDAALRSELSDSRAEYRSEFAAIRTDLRRIEDKVDDNTQRLARLEGIILAREGMVDTIVD
ncbi:MAG: hypothetical protein F4243_10500 [Chloroflexi bacterium]|nr:hypothetical protein [Chloroflexota bacterium]